VDGPARIAQLAQHPRPVIEVDDGWSGAAGGDDLGIGLIANERGDLVPVVLQLRQDM
jgi:hypothetical protein